MNLKTLTVSLIVILNLQFITTSAQQSKIDSLKQVISVAKQDTNSVIALEVLTRKYQKINIDSALLYANQGLELAKNLSYSRGIAVNSCRIGVIFSNLKSYKESNKFLDESLKEYLKLNNKQTVGHIINNIGDNFFYLKENNLAVKYLEEILLVAEESNNIVIAAYSYKNIGMAYQRMYNYNKAIYYYDKALLLFQKTDHTYERARINNFCGTIYANLGDNKRAIERYNRSLDINKAIGHKTGASMCYTNIGNIYRAQGSYNKAIDIYNKAIVIDKAQKDAQGLCINYNEIGISYTLLQDYNNAIIYYNKSLKIYEENGIKEGIGYFYTNTSVVYMAQKKYDNAYKNLHKSLKIAVELNNNQGIVANYSSLSELHLALASIALNEQQKNAELDTVIFYEKKAKQIIKLKKLGAKMPSYYINTSKAYWGLEQNNKAAELFNALINLENENILMNFSFLSEEEKENFFSTIEPYYWSYNSFTLQNTDSFPTMVETVYNNTVKNKGLLLKSNTAMRNAIYISNDSTLLQEYDNWMVLKRQIVRKYSNGEDATLLENKADSLEGYLVKNSNEFSDFKEVQNISWKQVQSSLKENEVAIEFTHFPLLNPDSSYKDFTNQTQYCALIVNKESKHPEMIPLFEKKQLENIIGKF